MQPVKMSQELMKARIQEVLQAGDPATLERRLEVCLWGLEKSKNGPAMVNALIAELGLEAHGQKPRAVPA